MKLISILLILLGISQIIINPNNALPGCLFLLLGYLCWSASKVAK